MASPVSRPPLDLPDDGFEVATVSADTLRAGVRVSGPLTAHSCGLLTSVLRTHVFAGRRYLRVDVEAARIDDPCVIDALVESHRDIVGLGGMLVFENACPRSLPPFRDAGLFVRAAD